MTLPAAGSPSAGERAVGWATVLAGLAYSSFLVMPFVGTRLDAGRSFVSEFAARDQPHGFVLRVVDAAVGVVVLVAGVHLVRSARPGAVRPAVVRPAVVRWAGGALGLFGVATVADAASPMSCAPSVDAACAAAEASRSGLAFGLHEATSTVSNAAAIVVVVLLVLARRRARAAGRPVSPFEGALLVGLPLIAVPGLVVVGEETVGLGLDAVVGYVQRVQVLALSAVLVAVGVVVLRGSRWERPA